MLIDFLLQDNTILLYLGSLKEKLVSHNLSYILKHKQDIFFSYLAHKTLRAITRLFFTNYFNQLFLMEALFLPNCIYLKDV